jgi:hypothetical protein
VNRPAVFVAYTPYHVLLAYCLARTEFADRDSILVLVEDAVGEIDYPDLILARQEPGFQEVLKLPGLFGEENRIRRKRVLFSNVRRLRRTFRHRDIGPVLVFNDARPESQYFLSRPGAGFGYFVEDGGAVYGADEMRAPAATGLVNRILFGRTWETVKVQGTSSHIKGLRLVHPRAVRRELREMPAAPISAAPLVDLHDEDQFRRAVFQRAGLPATGLPRLGAVLVLPHSERVVDARRYGELLEVIVTSLRDRGLRLGVKYHPRESAGNYLSVLVKNLVVLPRALPMESIFLWAGADLRFVLGDISTAFFTAPWLVPHIRAVSFARLLGDPHPDLVRACGLVGIRLPSDLEGLTASFS